MTRGTRRTTRILVIGAVAAIVLVAAGAITLRSILTPERLRSEILEATAASTGLHGTLDAAELSYVPFGVTIRELALPSDSPDDPNFLELESALVRLDLGALLRRSVVVRRIALEKPRVFLRQEDGVVILPGALAAKPGDAGKVDPTSIADTRPAIDPAASAAALGLSAAIESFEITDGAVSIATPGGAEDVQLEGIDLRGGLEVEAGAERAHSQGELSLAGLGLSALADWRETLDALKPVARYDVTYHTSEARLEIREVRLVADPLDLLFRGAIDGLPDDPELTLDLAPTSLELADLLALVPPDAFPEGPHPSARGAVIVSAHIAGPLADPELPPAIDARLELAGASVGLEDVPLGITDVRGIVTAGADEIVVENLSAHLGQGSLEIDGRITGVDVPESTRFDLGVRGRIHLADIERTGLAPEGLTAQGELELDLRALGAAADPTTTLLSGFVQLGGGAFRAPELPLPVTGLDARLSLEGRDAVLEKLVGSLGHSSFEVAGRISDLTGEPHVRLTGRVPRLDLVELAPPAAADGASSGTGSAGSSAPLLPPDAPLVPPLPDLAADVDVTIDSLLTVGGVLENVALTATLRDGKARVDAKVTTANFDGVVMSGFDASVDIVDESVTGGFHAPRVDAHGIPLTEVTGRVDLASDRQLSITGVTASVWTGSVEGDAQIDLTDLESPAFVIETEARGIEANDFVSALTPADGLLHGALDVSSRFEGKGSVPEAIAQSLAGDGTMNVSGGRLERTPAIGALWKALDLDERQTIDFRDLATAFRVEGGSIVTDDLALGGSDADWKISGATSFAGALDYDVQVELGHALSDKYRKRVGKDLATLLAGTTGRLVVDLEIGGTATKPSVKVDFDRLATRARENAARALEKKLKDGIGQGLKDLLGGGGAAADSADTTSAAEKPSLEDTLRDLLGGRKR